MRYLVQPLKIYSRRCMKLIIALDLLDLRRYKDIEFYPTCDCLDNLWYIWIKGLEL